MEVSNYSSQTQRLSENLCGNLTSHILDKPKKSSTAQTPRCIEKLREIITTGCKNNDFILTFKFSRRIVDAEAIDAWWGNSDRKPYETWRWDYESDLESEVFPSTWELFAIFRFIT
jgi:uroporphyrinogen-III decarboxylase